MSTEFGNMEVNQDVFLQKLQEEALKEIKSIKGRISKEPTARRTKERAEKWRKEVEDLWDECQRQFQAIGQSGESTTIEEGFKESLKVASEEIEKIVATLNTWQVVKIPTKEVIDENVVSIVTDRAVQLAILKKVVDRYSKWDENEKRTSEDVEYMEEKLSNHLKLFKIAHEKVPSSFRDYEALCLECDMINDDVIMMLSEINLSRHGDGPSRGARGRAVESDGPTADQFQQLLETLQGVCARNNVPNLPTLDIPTFTGNTKSWLTFKSAFESSITDHRGVSGVNKFRYLLRFVDGEPKSLISHLAVVDGSYETAWDLLLRRYDNKKILINS